MTAPPASRESRGTKASAAFRRARRQVLTIGRLDVAPPVAVLTGAGIGLAAIGTKVFADTVLGVDSGFILLGAAAVVAAWFAGLWAGVAATIVTATLNTMAFVAPEAGGSALTLRLDGVDMVRFALFTISGLIMARLVASLRTSRDDLAASLDSIARMAEDIERRDERLELVLAASHTGFWEWDIRTGDLTWSKTIFDQHGIDPADGPPTYERYIESIHPDDRATFQRSIDAALASGASFSHEFRILWPDGSTHWTHGVGRVFLDADGSPVRMMGTGQDITERRRLDDERTRLLDEERRAGAFREAFIDVISHELRTPITTIMGLTQLLARPGQLTSDVDEGGLIEDVAAESERLHRLVEDLLVLTRSERGEITVDAEPLELRRLLTRLIDREGLRYPGVSVDLELADDLPIVVGEATYVEQIVRNMLGNAAKYGGAGQVTVTAARDEGSVAVRVLDEGDGIDDETAAHAFDLFYRDPVRSRTVAGSGIGLFVCASLVRAMGGRIWARPRAGRGSEFGFTLRAVDDDDLAAPAGADERTGDRAAVTPPAG